MSVTLSPPMYLQFFDPNNSGAPLAGGLLFTYLAGTSTKQATWTDSTQTVTNSNPIVLDSNGAAYVWLDPTLLYKYVLSPKNDTDPPSSPLRTEDNISTAITAALITQSFLGKILYPQTAVEISAGVTPLAYQYPPGNALRYGVDPTGVADATAPMQNWINAAWAIYNVPFHDVQGIWNGSGGGAPVLTLPPGKYRMTGTVFLPNGVTFRGTGHPAHTVNHTRLIMDSTGVTPARTWTALTRLQPFARTLPTVPNQNGHFYQAQTTGYGTTGAGEPVWPTGGGTVVDGTVTWTDAGLVTAGDNRNKPMIKFGRGSSPRVGAGPNGALVNTVVTTSIQELEFWYVVPGASFGSPLASQGIGIGDYPLGGVIAFDVDAGDFDIVDCVFQSSPAAIWCKDVTTAPTTRGDGFTGNSGVGVFIDRCEFDASAAHIWAQNCNLYLRFNNCEMFGGPHVYSGCTGTVVYTGGFIFGNSMIDGASGTNTFTSFTFDGVYCEPPNAFGTILIQVNTTGAIDVSNNMIPTSTNATVIAITNATSGKINNNLINNAGLAAGAGTGIGDFVAAIKLIDSKEVDIKGNNLSANTGGSYGGFGILTASVSGTSQLNVVDGNTVTAPYNGATFNGQDRCINLATLDILGTNYNQHDGATGISQGLTRVKGSISNSLVIPTYGVTVAINAALGNTFEVVATNAVAFTIGPPTNPSQNGQQITIWVVNATGGAIGAITWTGFKMAAFTNPGTANSRSVTFVWNGAFWYEVSRTPADVPN